MSPAALSLGLRVILSAARPLRSTVGLGALLEGVRCQNSFVSDIDPRHVGVLRGCQQEGALVAGDRLEARVLPVRGGHAEGGARVVLGV